jgi:hypothetical protein
MKFNESSDLYDLSKNIKDYLVSIGLNKSLLDKDFISKIIKKKISKKELLELLSEDEISHINSIIRDSKTLLSPELVL